MGRPRDLACEAPCALSCGPLPSENPDMYLTIRALHVLCAGTWLGMVVFAVFWLNPMMHDFGPDAGKIGASLEKHRFMMAIPSISGITVLTGFYLFWRFTGAFSPDVMHSTSAMVFGTGGLLGFIAL